MRQTKRLKNRYLLVIPMFLFGFLLSAFPVNPTKVSAAGCAADLGFGVVTSDIDSKISITGSGNTPINFRVWSRIQTPDPAKSSYLLEIDGNTCINVGGNTTATNWTWVDYKDSTPSNKINVSLTPGDHTYRLVGNADGVLLDRIIFADAANTACNPPQDKGDNCVNPVNVAPTVTLAASPTSGTAPLSTTLTATPVDSDGIKQVDFYSGSGTTPIGTRTSAPWTWTINDLAAGTYTYTAKATDNANAVSISSNTVTVTSSSSAVLYPGDVHSSGQAGYGVVSITDLNAVLNHWNLTNQTRLNGELSDNPPKSTSQVTITDLNQVLNNWTR